MSQTGEKAMKITKEIKLENPKRCDGCPNLRYAKVGYESSCVLKYHITEAIHKGFLKDTFYIERPQSCVKENGE